MFCHCSTDYIGKEPNTLVCPVCLGLPGSLPVLNRRVVDLALRAALALHCQILPQCVFHRKNYFYPDLPKGYQISQYNFAHRSGWVFRILQSGSKKESGNQKGAHRRRYW